MANVHEQISEQFSAFENRGRGWQVFKEPITPEPPFEPFTGYTLRQAIDDGRRATALSSLVKGLSRWLDSSSSRTSIVPEPFEIPLPTLLRQTQLTELQTVLPANLNISRESFEAFLSSIADCHEPIAFEIIGDARQVSAQFAAHPLDAEPLRRALISYFPEAAFVPRRDSLLLFDTDNSQAAVVEFGLEREFFQPLTNGKIDPFIGLVGAMNELREDETALFQVLFQPCRHKWGESLLRAITDPSGKGLFANRPEFVASAKEKLAKPLYAAVVRMAAQGETFERGWEILRELAGPLRVFAHPNGNELIPLHNENYPFEEHLDDLLARQTRRAGMLLNRDELIGFVHLPSASVRARKFSRQATNSKSAPAIVTGPTGLFLGHNVHAGDVREIRLSSDQRTKHVHIIGASGSGKSTLLFNLIQQDLAGGQGIAVLDPHGDLIDRILRNIPEHRMHDVVLVDPSDETASIGFNILSAHSDLEKTLLASDLVGVFRRLSQSWGDQMEGVLRNAILAFLESSRGGTLAELRRFLLDSKFRQQFLMTVQDPDIRFYWDKAFSQLSGNKSIGPVLTRLETFLSPKPLRYMVAQRSNKLDFSDILDSGKIFLAKLSQGAIGTENAYLLGSLLMAKLQQTAMSRQRQAAAGRRDFWIYLDEFQNFITPSMAQILTDARKYRVGLTLAHHELRQLERDRDVASAVLSNPYTRIVFRVGDADARALENGFSAFTAKDLQNLPPGEAMVRVERSEFDFNLTVPLPEDLDTVLGSEREAEIIKLSRTRYATPRDEIEAELAKQFETYDPPKEAPAKQFPKVAEPSTQPAKVELKEETASILPSSPGTPPSIQPPKVSVVLPPVTSPPPLPRSLDLGRGGEQHKAIQRRLKEAGEQAGFLTTTEYPLQDGSVDVAFLSSKRKIAAEITVTTTIDHEVKNVTKCLRAGFDLIAVVSSSETKLKQMEEAVMGTLGPASSPRVSYFLPDALITYLHSLGKEDCAAQPQPPTETIRRGYKVKRSAANLTPEELKAREATAIRVLAESMKRKK